MSADLQTHTWGTTGPGEAAMPEDLADRILRLLVEADGELSTDELVRRLNS